MKNIPSFDINFGNFFSTIDFFFHLPVLIMYSFSCLAMHIFRACQALGFN